MWSLGQCRLTWNSRLRLMFSCSSVRVHHHRYLQELANLNGESLTTLLHASRCFLKSLDAGQIFATALVCLMKFGTVYCVFMNTISQMKHSSQVWLNVFLSCHWMFIVIYYPCVLCCICVFSIFLFQNTTHFQMHWRDAVAKRRTLCSVSEQMKHLLLSIFR